MEFHVSWWPEIHPAQAVDAGVGCPPSWSSWWFWSPLPNTRSGPREPRFEPHGQVRHRRWVFRPPCPSHLGCGWWFWPLLSLHREGGIVCVRWRAREARRRRIHWKGHYRKFKYLLALELSYLVPKELINISKQNFRWGMVYKHISFVMEDMALPVFKYAYIHCKTTESICSNMGHIHNR
jgi:hypothetical protein